MLLQRYRRPPSWIARGASDDGFANAIFSLVFLYILFDVMVGIVYTATDSILDKQEAVVTADGNPFRQLIYSTVIAVTLLLALYRSNFRITVPISHAYHLGIAWAILSSSWAIEPGQSIRRSLLMYAILLPFTVAIHHLGARRTIHLVYMFLAAAIVASLVSVLLHSIPIFAFSIHPIDESDPSVAGAWRGIFSHKNAAGPVAVHASILFLYHGISRGRKLDWFLLILTVVFLIGTRSKTALALALFVICMGGVYHFFMSRKAAPLFSSLMAFVMAFIAVLVLVSWSDVVAFFNNWDNLTGRVAIWQSMIPYIRDHPWLGSGYGSFWGIGDSAPIYRYAVLPFILRLGTSHNGFLEVLATTGIIGLLLAIAALVILPFYRFANPKPNNYKLNSMLFAMWFFGILQNLTESQFFSPEKQSWILVVVAITVVQSRYLKYKRGDLNWLRQTSWPFKLPVKKPLAKEPIVSGPFAARSPALQSMY
ncbi:O-antigen ligase family protein (plasmid) [Rhizobium sp. CB3171]|uniref:O-antigen ligase family protein n=1 Tax=Rhizobium sp. CB3171 TaxID=3039157 RepID=UPI0024B1C5C1|nr:O-antigen ligase family protein [Rhizobium sp. CB3171]WFU07146.1 O-antigen ligase family protein [Rhizobium sp. CB3171]